MPPVSPKEWNTGSALNTLSVFLENFMRAPTWAIFARILACESTTPFGSPSEPEVNKITAGSSGFVSANAFLAVRRASAKV